MQQGYCGCVHHETQEVDVAPISSMAPDDPATLSTSSTYAARCYGAPSRRGVKVTRIMCSASIIRVRHGILLALLSAACVTLAGGELQSTFNHHAAPSTLSGSTDGVKSSEAQISKESLVTSELPEITSTGNSQIFPTGVSEASATALASEVDSSNLQPWELPGVRTQADHSSQYSAVTSTVQSVIKPTQSNPQSEPSVVSEPASSGSDSSRQSVDSLAATENDVLDKSSSETVPHINRFSPTDAKFSISSQDDPSVSSSAVVRMARSIEHSATASAGSRQLVGKVAESGERLPAELKTAPLTPLTRDKPLVSGEARRAPRAEAHAISAAVGPHHLINATARRSEPDIQDIITGIVKLLGGNVNVAAVPAPQTGRPLRPMGTRINNRGPPRITDVNYEGSSTPASSTPPPPGTRQPPPYPFDRPPPPPPHQHIPFPGMEDSESFMSPPPLPQTSSQSTQPTPRPSTRPRPTWPRPQLPNRRPAYPDVPQQEEKSTVPPSSSTSEEPSTTTSTTTTTTTTTPAPSTTSTTPSTTTEEETSPPTSPPPPASTTPVLPPIISDFAGIGVAEPVQLESSISELAAPSSSSSSATPPTPASTSRPSYGRPGLVLDDPEFKPGAVGQGVPIITAPVRGHRPVVGEVFDVTVTAVQGPGGGQKTGHPGHPLVFQVPVNDGPKPGVHNGDVITRPEDGQHFVSIDGKRTYINLFPTEAGQEGGEATAVSGQQQQQQRPSPPTPPPPGTVLGTGVAIPEPALRPGQPAPGQPPPQPPARRRPGYTRRPPVRIDTCIVGDGSTCDESQNEACRTEQGVSSCHCKPGFSRRKHREPCRRIVSIMLNMRVDRLYEQRMAWSAALTDSDSEDYQQLEWESVRAIDSAMGMTPFSDEFMGAKVNGFLKGGIKGEEGKFVVVNATLQLAETAETLRANVKHDLQRHLLGVITRRNNNIGESALWVDKPPGAISGLQDLDECSSADLHDCHPKATCTNIFGSFRCACAAGLRDPWAGNAQRSGRTCEACPADFCSNRGECAFQPSGEKICSCSGNFYGTQCELDGEVLGVAIGASVAALLIIGLTLLGLCMWSRRWNREQQKAEMLSTRTGITSPVFSYMAAAAAASSAASVKSGLPPGGAAPYVSVEDRLRWAHIADVMAQNHYAQPEPGAGMPTRPSSAVFGAYPSLHGTMHSNMHGSMGTMHSLHGTLPLSMMGRPPPPITGPPDSSDEEDQRDLLGRNFHVPRPRSRAASIANQSGIYYDVDYDTRPAPVPAPRSTLPRPPQAAPPPIPMATYMRQGGFFRS